MAYLRGKDYRCDLRDHVGDIIYHLYTGSINVYIVGNIHVPRHSAAPFRYLCIRLHGQECTTITRLDLLSHCIQEWKVAASILTNIPCTCITGNIGSRKLLGRWKRGKCMAMMAQICSQHYQGDCTLSLLWRMSSRGLVPQSWTIISTTHKLMPSSFLQE